MNRFLDQLARAPEAGAGAAPAPAPAPAPGAPGVAGSLAPPAAGGAPAAPPAQDWLAGLAPEERAYYDNKQWKGPEETLRSYIQLEKLLGPHGEGRTVVLPKDGAAPEELAEFYTKLGRPAAADKYELKAGDSANPELMAGAKKAFYDAGLNPKQAQQLLDFYAGAETTQKDAAAQRAASELDGLVKELGPQKYEEALARVKTAGVRFGLTQEMGEKIELAIGSKAFLSLFAGIGEALAESGLPPGSTGAPGGVGLTTKAAQDKLNALNADSAFQNRLNSVNPKVRGPALEEYEAALKAAHPG